MRTNLETGGLQILVLLVVLLGTSIDLQRSEIHEWDRLVQDVFQAADTSRYSDAVDAFANIVRLDAAGLSDDERAIRDRHLEATFTVMPSDQRAKFGEPLAGEDLVRWWRRQDQLPGTERNERLEEHLARFVFASTEYRNDDDPRGYDDRGEVFVRFGPPVDRVSVRLPETARAVDFRDVLTVPKLPDNELWLYPNINDEAYYFFVRDSRREGFRLGLPSEVVPMQLRGGLDQRNPRGRHRAQALLAVMEEVYAQLALAHPIFGSIHDRLAHYRGRVPSSQERPDQFIQTTVAEASALESESEGRRERVVPAAYSNTRGDAEDLPAHVRWARFLDDDGTTRTEVFWSVEVGLLEPSDRLVRKLAEEQHETSDSYLLTMSAARQTSDYVTRDIQSKYYRVDPAATDVLQPQSIVLRGDTGRYHLGLQWNQYWLEDGRAPKVRAGALLKVGTMRIDSLEALHGRGERLEVSDLMPIRQNQQTPFPFETLRREAPPDLYFEVYNLHYGPDDMTHYSIEYEVARDAGRDRVIQVRSSHKGNDRDTQERIAVELGDAEEGERVHLSIRAIDEVTGESVQRSISFRL